MVAFSSRRRALVAASLVFGLCFLAGAGAIILRSGPSGQPPEGTPIAADPGDRPPNGDGPGNGQNGDRDGDDPAPQPDDPGAQDPYLIRPGDLLVVGSVPGSGEPVRVPDPPEIVTGVPAGSGRVALTFDCGWEFEQVPSLLAVLDGYGLKVTFFPRAKWLEDHPGLAGEILAAGHEIGSHSYTHPDLTKLTAEEVDREIRLAKETLIGIAGADAFVPLYRPPYGAHNATVSAAVARYGYGWVVMWQVDSLDWTEPGVEAIVERVLGRVRDGGIVLMHVGTMQTVEALPAIIEGLHGRGYEIVQVSELLGIGKGASGKEPVTYRVREGDTLYAIAGRFGTTVERLLELNPELKPAP